MDKAFSNYLLEDRSYVSYIKRAIHKEVAGKAFSEKQVGEIDIIVSELTSNLIKHAGGGELLYRTQTSLEGDDIFEVLSIDSGPGIMDTSKMLRDGVSTTNTLGNGLGAIQRLSNVAQFYSIPQWGTVVYALVTTREDKFQRRHGFDLDIRALCVNKPREEVCGDGVSMKKTESSVQFFLGDGLGHGEFAKEAVVKAAEFFKECMDESPVDIIRQMHEQVRKTRGLVATVAVFDTKNNNWKICGVGNISTRMYTGIAYKNYMAYNGAIGLTLPSSLKESVFDIERNQHLVLTTDGIRSRWELAKYPSILKYDNMVMAAAVYKDFTRKTDDASVLIAKVI